jgi:hypothetical protein
MDLKNKLKNLPTIYYVNLDNRIDRREYMETQFDFWGIKNFHRISATKYLASKIESWKDAFVNGDPEYYLTNAPVVANSITHLELIKDWINNTNEQYMIMMEDDYDLNLIEYWHFDWDYLMNNIPYDWDCIQLGFESNSYINFFLHPKLPASTYFGPCMINRNYAKKILNLHYQDNKVNLLTKTNLKIYKDKQDGITPDYFICGNGKTYCIPLITCNNDLLSLENSTLYYRDWHVKSRNFYYEWWMYERDNFSLDDFFTYGKPYDSLMRKYININLSVEVGI